MDKQQHLIVGIDIGKHYHQATVIDGSGQIQGPSTRFSNTTTGVELLLKRITSVNPAGLPCKADETYYIEASRLLELANRAYELFESSEDAQKRELLNFLLQNSKMDGNKLIPTLQMPFDAILEANKTNDWHAQRDSNPRPIR